MTQEKKETSQEKPTQKDQLKWEKKQVTDGLFDLIQPIISNFILLADEEKKRTIDKLSKTKKMLEKMRETR